MSGDHNMYCLANNKPVAWMSPDGKVSTTEGKLFYKPLYTHQHKELSYEEIASIWKEQWEGGNIGHIAYTYAKAIIKASRGEE